MKIIPTSVENLILALEKLPGVGPRTAERLAFHLLKSDPVKAVTIGAAMESLHAGVLSCSLCHNFAEAALCNVCDSDKRNHAVVCVVEEPFDVVAIEKTGQFDGVYHVLGGAISPMDGVGPDRLEIASLLERVRSSDVQEIILATNPSLEGESTAMYIRQQIADAPITVTRLARGLPVGGDLEYADQITLGRALQGRQTF